MIPSVPVASAHRLQVPTSTAGASGTAPRATAGHRTTAALPGSSFMAGSPRNIGPAFRRQN